MNDRKDEEENRLSARAARYVRVGTNVGAVAARVAGQRLFGLERRRRQERGGPGRGAGRPQGPDHEGGAAAGHHPRGAAGRIRAGAVAAAVAGAAHGAGLRAPAHGGRAGAGVGGALQELRAAAGRLGLAGPGASRALPHDGRALAGKLQYPDMQSAVEADLNQLKVVFALHARMNPAVDTGEILQEVSARLREELDYELEARHTALYALIFKDEPQDPRAGGGGASCRPSAC